MSVIFIFYSGETEKEAIQFMADMVTEKCKDRPGKVKVHQTSAVNTKKMQKILGEILKK